MSTIQNHYYQYIDGESGIVIKPQGEGWSDPTFGDGVWRSSWFYASLLVIANSDPNSYERLKSEHGIETKLVKKFLGFFRSHCLGNTEWSMPKAPEQQFSRDQLVPLLYLLAAVRKFAPSDYVEIARDILRSLIHLEEHGRGVSNTQKGSIGRNIGYMIDVLCDDDRYNLIYRSSDMNFWRVSALGNEKKAKKNRRAAYKKAFSLSLKAHELTGWAHREGLDITDEYSVFNALGAVSLQCIAWGKDDGDVKDWRSNFKMHSDSGWGPAFKLVSGRDVTETEIEEFYDAHVTRQLDNDIIMAQRPQKIQNGTLHPNLKGGENQWLVLDYVILKALSILWN